MVWCIELPVTVAEADVEDGGAVADVGVSGAVPAMPVAASAAAAPLTPAAFTWASIMAAGTSS